MDTLQAQRTNPIAIKPAYNGHLRFLKKVSAIARCPLYRGFKVIFTGSKFREFWVFWTILRKLVSARIIAKLLIRKTREI